VACLPLLHGRPAWSSLSSWPRGRACAEGKAREGGCHALGRRRVAIDVSTSTRSRISGEGQRSLSPRIFRIGICSRTASWPTRHTHSSQVHKNVYKTRIRKLWNTVFTVAQTPRLWQARNPHSPLTLLNLMF
jgi:hypothetical protein